jgi:hypothetical protein
MTIWSDGQVVTSIDDSVSTKTLIDRLKVQFVEALKRQQEVLKKYL